MTDVRGWFFAAVVVLLGVSASDGADTTLQSVTVNGWNKCGAVADDNCVTDKSLQSVEVYTIEGLSAGTRNLSAVKLAGARTLNTEYSTIKVQEHGCTNAEATVRDDSCWIRQQLVAIRRCGSGAVSVTGQAHSQQAAAVSMGSGSGCRQ